MLLYKPKGKLHVHVQTCTHSWDYVNLSAALDSPYTPIFSFQKFVLFHFSFSCYFWEILAEVHSPLRITDAKEKSGLKGNPFPLRIGHGDEEEMKSENSEAEKTQILSTGDWLCNVDNACKGILCGSKREWSSSPILIWRLPKSTKRKKARYRTVYSILSSMQKQKKIKTLYLYFLIYVEQNWKEI